MNDFTKEAYSALPEEVKQAGLFCLWNYEDRGGAKKTKVPYDPVTRQRAKSNDPATFADFSTAISVKGYSGIGIGILTVFLLLIWMTALLIRVFIHRMLWILWS